ncbi:hypothetical protein [Methylovulum psychrotolerans]|uniref:Uncharacterized protein n=1 Tax=Methylovulum psychrotolerans TaxID=1704499 RepID=A0A2S5CHV4_9GAMM|nr:hypothetical protein [Methylovulum psychrotolerans]POZ50386.1 hypothetical protein AADEFJLK_03799 [Methylovulum psychrotolerans]
MEHLLKPPIEALPYCWLVEFGALRCGVHQKNGWCVQNGDRIIICDSLETCMPLMPILEMDDQLFFDFLAEIKLSNPFYSEAIDSFPKAYLIRHVFEFAVSEYWPELALVWVSHDKALQSLLKPILKMFAQKKSMPQSLRHKARRLAA